MALPNQVKKEKFKFTGNVRINGKLLVDSNELSSISTYVEQYDLFIGTLKVKEHLKFQVLIL